MMTYTIAVQIMNFNESPVFLLLDDNMGMKHKNLPVNLYESGELLHRLLYINLTICNSINCRHPQPIAMCLAELHILDCHPQSVFVEAKYKIEVCAEADLSTTVLPGVSLLFGTSKSNGTEPVMQLVSDAVLRYHKANVANCRHQKQSA